MTMNAYQRVMLIIGLFLMFCAGFTCYMGPYSEPSMYREAFAFGGGLFMLLGAISIQQPLKMPFISILALVFMLVFFVQSKLLHYPYSAVPLQSMMYALWCGLLGFAAFQYKEVLGNEHFYHWIGTAIVLAGLLAAGGSLVIALSGGVIETSTGSYVIFNKSTGEMIGPLNQGNQFSTFLLCALVSTAWIFQSGRFRWVFLFFVGVLLSAVYSLTNSRVGVLELLALLAGAVLVVFLSRKNTNRFALNLLLLSLIALLFLAIVPGLIKKIGLVQESVSTLSRLTTDKYGIVERSSMLRVEVWQRAWHIFLAHPLLGVGVGNFATFDFIERAAGAGLYDQHALKFTHAHNIVLQLAAELGVLGLALLATFSLKCCELLRRTRAEPRLLYPLAILICLGFHSMTEFPLWYAFFMGMLIVFSVEFSAFPIPERQRKLLVVAACIFVLIIAMWGMSVVYGLYRIEKSYIESAYVKPETAVNHLLDDSGVTGSVAQYTEPFLISMVLPNSSIKNNAMIAEMAERVAEASPNVFYVYRLPLWQLSAGQREKAFASLTKAYAMHPPGLQSLVQAKGMAGSTITKQWIDELLAYAKDNLDNKPVVKKWYSESQAPTSKSASMPAAY